MKTINKSFVCRLIALTLGLSIIILLIYITGFNTLIDSLRRIEPKFIALAVIVYGSSWIFRTLRLRLFTDNTVISIASFELFQLQISSYALNVVFPAKLGDVAMVGYLNRRGMLLGDAAAIAVQSRILDVIALVLLSSPAMIIFSEKTNIDWIKSTLLISAILVICPAVVVLLDRNDLINYMLKEIGSRSGNGYFKTALEKIRETYNSYVEIISNRTLFIISIIISMTIWLFDIITCYVIGFSLGLTIPFFVVILAVCLANVGKSVPATPGSIGIYEGILAAVLVIFGIPSGLAIVIAILDHAVKNLFTLAIGLPATMRLGFKISKEL